MWSTVVNKTKKTTEFIINLSGAAILLRFYYENFDRDDSVKDDSKCYQFVKRAFIYPFEAMQEQEDAISNAKSESLNKEDLEK